ncbi:MAG: POTRA domain-containing protein [candidate division WOR-3 bacterium]
MEKYFGIFKNILKINKVFIFLFLLLYGCFGELRQGEFIKVLKINFKGNHFVKGNKLKNLLPIKEGDQYVEQFIKETPQRLISYYRSRGFFSMRILKMEGEFDSKKNGFIITYHIFEGTRSKIDSVEIVGNKIFSEKYIIGKLSIKKGSYYDEGIIDAGRYALSTSYAEKGFVDASIKIERYFLDEGEKRVYLKVIIEEGEKIYVRNIKIKGLESVRYKVARRELRIKEEELYRPSLVYLSQSNLYKTELFSHIRVIEEKVKKDSVDITFILKEEKSRFFQIGMGYESPRKTLFNFKWGDLDLFGNLQRLITDFYFKGVPQKEENKFLTFKEWEQEYRLSYRESYLFGSGFNLIISPSLLRREFESAFSFEFVLEREFLPFSILSFPYEYKRATITEDTISITNRISGRFLFDKRRNILNPNKGLRLLIQYDYAGRIFGGDNHFDRLTFDFASFYPLPFRLVLAQRSRVIVTFPKEDPLEISPDIRLEMGGYGSLRGFDEASIGFPDPRPNRKSGLDELLFNIELRINVYKNLYTIIFSDFGSLWMEPKEISLNDFNVGFGFGIGYGSPIGVIRLDYARASKEISKDYRGKIYLNFGHPF